MFKSLRFVRLSVVFFFAASWAHAQNSLSYVEGEIIVRLKSKSSSSASYAFLGKAHSEKAMVLKQSWGKMNLYHFGLKPGQSVEDAVREMRADPDVLYAEPNYILRKASETDFENVISASDLRSSNYQSMAGGGTSATGANIGLSSVWSSSSVPPAVKPIVAVIDTGLDTQHSVISGTNALWTNNLEAEGLAGVDDDGNGYVDDIHGWNFVSNSGTMLDDDGHGTHVAGIILSVDQNIFLGTLRESKIQIMPLKFLDSNGLGSTASAIRAIYYAVNNGATVLNNSWGGATYSSALLEAVAYTYSKGAIFVAAAGNAASNNDAVPMYPASYDVPNVIAIAATTDYDYLANFSNYGSKTVDLGSPGVSIYSMVPDDYFGFMSGTSMAAPFVAGTAAQMKVESPSMNGYQIRAILMTAFASSAQLANRVVTGGRLNAGLAVSSAKSSIVDFNQPGYTVSFSADRDLASAMAPGGCGTVQSVDDGNPPFGPPGAALVVIALLLAPLAFLLMMRSRAPETRRRYDRFRINTDVRISVGDKELVGSVSSISLGGVCVNTSALLQDGGLVTMTISSPDGKEKLEVAGRVVWSEANKAYGVAFAGAPESTLSLISNWTKGLQKAS